MRWRASVLVVSAAVAVAPWPWAWVDRWWASRWYVTVQRVATPLFARLPWPAVDVLFGALIAWWGLQAVRDLRRTRADGVGLGRAVRAVARRTVVTAAILHLKQVHTERRIICGGRSSRRSVHDANRAPVPILRPHVDFHLGARHSRREQLAARVRTELPMFAAIMHDAPDLPRPSSRLRNVDPESERKAA